MIFSCCSFSLNKSTTYISHPLPQLASYECWYAQWRLHHCPWIQRHCIIFLGKDSPVKTVFILFAGVSPPVLVPVTFNWHSCQLLYLFITWICKAKMYLVLKDSIIVRNKHVRIVSDVIHPCVKTMQIQKESRTPWRFQGKCQLVISVGPVDQHSGGKYRKDPVKINTGMSCLKKTKTWTCLSSFHQTSHSVSLSNIDKCTFLIDYFVTWMFYWLPLSVCVG